MPAGSALGPPPRPRAVAGAGWSAEGASPLSAKLLGAGPTGRRPGEGAVMGPHARPPGAWLSTRTLWAQSALAGAWCRFSCPHLGRGPPGADDPAGDAAELPRPSFCPATEGARAAPSTVARETLPALSHRTSPAGHVNLSVLLFLDFLRGSIHPPIIVIDANYRKAAPALDTCGSQLPYSPQRGPSGLGLTGADLAFRNQEEPGPRRAALSQEGWGGGWARVGLRPPFLRTNPPCAKFQTASFSNFLQLWVPIGNKIRPFSRSRAGGVVSIT